MACVASLLAWVPAWLIMRHWLEGFAYRVDIGPEILLFATIFTIGVVMLAVLGQTLRAALINPADAIRHE